MESKILKIINFRSFRFYLSEDSKDWDEMQYVENFPRVKNIQKIFKVKDNYQFLEIV